MAHAHRVIWSLFLLAVAGAAWAAPPSYRVTELEGFVPEAINNRGQIVGNAAGGGFTHGGHFVLLDGQRRIRGVYDGTKEASVNQLMQDIPLLLNEKQHAQK